MDLPIASKPSDRRKYFDGVRFGAVDVFHFGGNGSQSCARKYAHIRQDRVDDFVLSIPLKAKVTLWQDGEEVSVVPDCFGFVATSRPFQARIAAETLSDDSFAAIQVRVSGPRLRQRIPRIDECCAKSISIRPGVGSIMRSLLNAALSDGAFLTELEALRFGNLLVNAFANTIVDATELPLRETPEPRSAQTRILAIAKNYIENHLSDPDLGGPMIAKHLRISPRYLQAIFAVSEETVGQFIREARLRRCREALLEPTLRTRTITTIASDWGFTSSSHFTRAYRSHFGKSPSEERRDVMQTAAD